MFSRPFSGFSIPALSGTCYPSASRSLAVVAARWGIVEVVAETDPGNMRMLSLLHKRGFDCMIPREEEVVFQRKSLL